MTRERWLSLGLQEDALPAFEEGGLRTIEAADNGIVGIPKHGAGHHLLGALVHLAGEDREGPQPQAAMP